MVKRSKSKKDKPDLTRKIPSEKSKPKPDTAEQEYSSDPDDWRPGELPFPSD